MTSYTVENWIKYWLDTFQRIKLKPSCMDSYKSILRVRIAPHIGHILLTDLQAEDVQKMYFSLQKRGLSAKSIIILLLFYAIVNILFTFYAKLKLNID